VLGVLDIDSPDFSRFDATDQQWLERFVRELVPLWPPADHPRDPQRGDGGAS
jgi:hypothetical protein